MKVLITGASGLLGHKLVEELAKRGYEVIAIYNRTTPIVKLKNVKWVKLDLCNGVAIEDLVLKVRPDVVVHAAAYTDVDGCEVNKEYAWKVNVAATRRIVRACRVIRSYVVYISTDYVFDGCKGLYKEGDAPNPVNYYGLTKLIAEQIVESSDLLYTIVRPSAIYGVGTGKMNFALFVADKLLRNEIVKAVEDQYVSPTLNTALAKAIAEIIEMKPMGILHIAGERISRYSFAQRIAELLGVDKQLVKPVKMCDMNWKARRPRDSSLDTSRAKELISEKLVFNLEESLRLFVEEYRAWRGL